MRLKLCESEFDAVDICTVGFVYIFKIWSNPIRKVGTVIGSCSINDKHWVISEVGNRTWDRSTGHSILRHRNRREWSQHKTRTCMDLGGSATGCQIRAFNLQREFLTLLLYCHLSCWMASPHFDWLGIPKSFNSILPCPDVGFTLYRYVIHLISLTVIISWDMPHLSQSNDMPLQDRCG